MIATAAYALAVALQAQKEGVSEVRGGVNLKERIDALFWEPEYLPYQHVHVV